MRGGVDQAASKGGCQEVAEGVALLQHAGNDAACLLRTVFERGGSRVAIQTTHGDAEEGAHPQKLIEGLREAGRQLEHDKENVIDDEGPFTSPSI